MDTNTVRSSVSLDCVSFQIPSTSKDPRRDISQLPGFDSDSDSDVNDKHSSESAASADEQIQSRTSSTGKPRYSKPQRKKKRRHRKSKRDKRRGAQGNSSSSVSAELENLSHEDKGANQVNTEANEKILPRFNKTKKLKCRYGDIILNYSDNIEKAEEARIKKMAQDLLKNERRNVEEERAKQKIQNKIEKIRQKRRKRKSRQRKQSVALQLLRRLCCIR